MHLSVFDAAGRQVATLAARHVVAGEAEILWDGRDARGNEVPRGIYFLSFRTQTEASGLKLTLVR